MSVLSSKAHQKNGKWEHRQRYLCLVCGHTFQNIKHKPDRTNQNLWNDYVFENQTVRALAKRYGISTRTVRRNLDRYRPSIPKFTPAQTVVIMDTSYFGRSYGVMVFRDHYRSQNIHWKFVRYETLFEYQAGIRRIEFNGWQIKAIVCDGRRGLFNSFGEIPVQMCHFHQISIVTRYLTQKPKLPAGRELKGIVATLPQSNRSDFENSLEQWYQKWAPFLSEKSINWETGKQTYTHRRIRSAYRSLKTNLPYLFTYQNYPDLDIPNTTNSLEGVFSNLKTKLRNHTGLKYHRKAKLISEILSN